MSMIGCFFAVSDKDLESIIEQPERIRRIWQDSESDGWEPVGQSTGFDVDKAWHGIHFMLTGSDWEGEGPLAFILHGGREIEEDPGYGPPHGFTSAEVKEINVALQAVDEAALFERANPEEFARMEIYPQIWDKEPKEE